ncbi:MAG: 50S ribosomal protein L23 [Xanthomonadaceae bacterium]|nr:50S ribosomal protein L23 [Xanthomonadaceae bacterium]
MSTNEKIYSVLRAPRVSEKTARLQESTNQYVFEVSTEATKADVKAAVEQLFDVKVESVNVVNVKGKNKSFRFRKGRRGDWRKAYVRLADGQAIDVATQA